MGFKRSAEDLDPISSSYTTKPTKRTKLSPSHQQHSDSSIASDRSVSEDSALQSTPPASERSRKSSISTPEPASTDGDDDRGSSPSTSDDSSDQDSDEEQDTPTIGGPRKPRMRKLGTTDGAADLRARLAALLPQMEEANARLAGEPGGASIEDVEDGEQYIEMDLGLGVLEEQNNDDDSDSRSSGDGDNEDEEEDVLGRLMGIQRMREAVGIEDAD